ncbi:hypothetical protein YC2023_016592 [Brassica napus]
MNVVAGRMRNTTLGTNELILCSVVKSLFLLNMSAFKTMGTSEEKPASSTQAYYGGGGTPNPFFPSKDQAIFVGVKLAIIQRHDVCKTKHPNNHILNFFSKNP